MRKGSTSHIVIISLLSVIAGSWAARRAKVNVPGLSD